MNNTNTNAYLLPNPWNPQKPIAGVPQHGSNGLQGLILPGIFTPPFNYSL
jgi:hypothetical protein